MHGVLCKQGQNRNGWVERILTTDGVMYGNVFLVVVESAKDREDGIFHLQVSWVSKMSFLAHTRTLLVTSCMVASGNHRGVKGPAGCRKLGAVLSPHSAVATDRHASLFPLGVLSCITFSDSMSEEAFLRSHCSWPRVYCRQGPLVLLVTDIPCLLEKSSIGNARVFSRVMANSRGNPHPKVFPIALYSCRAFGIPRTMRLRG